MEVALCLYRITQECLNNVAKHSGAREAVVAIKKREGDIFLSITDDGTGFDPGLVADQKGLGIVGIRERVRLVDGTRFDRLAARARNTDRGSRPPDKEDGSMKRPRVLLADDHTLVLDGLRKILDPECEVVGAVEDGRSLLAAATRLKPDIILLDISMPLLNGVEAARRLRAAAPDAKVIFVTMHADATYVAGAFRAGASGYVLKRCASVELLKAINQVLSRARLRHPLDQERPWTIAGMAALGLGRIRRTDRSPAGSGATGGGGTSGQRNRGDSQHLRQNCGLSQGERDAEIGYPQHC